MARSGVFRPHEACPFDGDEFIRKREILRIQRRESVYHVVLNRFPVTPHHFIAIRPGGAPAASLPQYLQGPREIGDILSCLQAVGPDYRAYFNSNRGADGSRSGSSVNHWHFQFFLYPWPCTPFEEESCGGEPMASSTPTSEVICRSFPAWPARHVVFESGDPGNLALDAWSAVDAVNRRNIAYNLEARQLAGGRLRVFLFPRHPAPAASVPGLGALSSDFGGWEMSGDLVIPTREMFDWHVRNPAEAERLSAERMRATTVDPPTMQGGREHGETRSQR